MRTYESRCSICGKFGEYRRHTRDCMDTPECCGGKTIKIIRTPPKGFVSGRWEAFKSPVDGSIISTAQDLKRHNQRNNVMSMADGHSTEQLMKMTGAPPKREEVKKGDVIEAIRALQQGADPQRGVEI